MRAAVFLALAALLALPGAIRPAAAQPGASQPGAAQPVTYCNGRLTAERFEVRGLAGPEGRSHFMVHLVNTQSVPLRVVVLFTGDALDRPEGTPRGMPPGGRLTAHLGHQTRRPGVPPMTPDRLAAATRISCL
jgi:hypothetical protein